MCCTHLLNLAPRMFAARCVVLPAPRSKRALQSKNPTFSRAQVNKAQRQAAHRRLFRWAVPQSSTACPYLMKKVEEGSRGGARAHESEKTTPGFFVCMRQRLWLVIMAGAAPQQGL